MTTSTASPVLSARAALPILVLTLVWGCNWPVLKMGVTELAPLTFRSLTLPLAALGMLIVARVSGDRIRVPRRLWPRLLVLAMLNIGAWNGLVLFGVQQLPAGRSAILAYTMPIWATMIATVVLHEPLSRRKLLGLALGVAGMGVLIGEQIAVVRAAPFGALMILGAAIAWAMGTVLLRKWKLPVAVSSLSSLPVPVVGVISGILVLGERPGVQEWIALALVVAALSIVLFQPSGRRATAAPLAPDD